MTARRITALDAPVEETLPPTRRMNEPSVVPRALVGYDMRALRHRAAIAAAPAYDWWDR